MKVKNSICLTYKNYFNEINKYLIKYAQLCRGVGKKPGINIASEAIGGVVENNFLLRSIIID